MNKKVLVTGASGFVGGALLKHIEQHTGFEVRGAVRKQKCDEQFDVFECGAINGCTDWRDAFIGVEVVIHAAALAHISSKKLGQEAFDAVNHEGTINLARQAANKGVSRFVFISSIGVHGGSSQKPFHEDHMLNPIGPYAVSKWHAEEDLWRVQKETGMEIVIIRPPLVYGPGAPGNFKKLMGLVSTGLPLPFGSIKNKRSFVALGNLIDLIVRCIDHPCARNQVFLAGDGQDISTLELVRFLGECMGKKNLLVPIPVRILRWAVTLIGRKTLAVQLFDSLQVDISKARNLLGWEPPLSVEQGIKLCFQ